MVFAAAREDVVLGSFAAVWSAEAEEVVILATPAADPALDIVVVG